MRITVRAKIGSPSSRLATSNFPAAKPLALLDWTGSISLSARIPLTQCARSDPLIGRPLYQGDRPAPSTGAYIRVFGVGTSDSLTLRFNVPATVNATITATVVQNHSLYRNMSSLLTENTFHHPEGPRTQ